MNVINLIIFGILGSIVFYFVNYYILNDSSLVELESI